MKRILAVLLSLLCIFSLASCNSISVEKPQETAPKATDQPTQATDLTSVHGWFNLDDHAEITFRGQSYYNTLASGLMIMDNRMEGIAYITSKDITDDEQAEKEGVKVRFNADQEIPDILMMSTEDYFKGENYDKSLYYEYQYFCKEEEWSILGQKLRTQAFNNLYVMCFDADEPLSFDYSVGKHELLKDDVTAVIKRTVKQDTADYLDITKLYSGDFKAFLVSRCDKNMLVDPRSDQYTIFMVDGEYYIGDWYSIHFLHVAEEDKALVEAMMKKYAHTVDVLTAYYKELLSDSPSISPENSVLMGESA